MTVKPLSEAITVPAWLRAAERVVVDDSVIGCTLDDMLYDLMRGPFICGDAETTGTNIIDDQIVSLQFCASATKAWFVPVAMLGMNNFNMAYLAYKLAPVWKKGMVFHNGGFDWQFIQRFVDFEIVADTMIEAKCIPDLWSHPRDFSLKGLVKHFFKIDVIEFNQLFPRGSKEGAKRFDLVPHDLAVPYGCQDPLLTFRLHEHLLPQIDTEHFIYGLEHQVIKPLARMELLGIGFNTELMAAAETEARQALDELAASIYGHAGKEFLLSSPQQLAVVLFDELGLTPPEGGRSTAVAVLNALAGDHPIIEDVLDYRGMSKLKTAFIDALPSRVASDGNIHCSINAWGAITGRTSCSEPNLQQIPKPKGKTGDNFRALLRQAFIPPQGYVALLDQDYCVSPETRILKTDLTWDTASRIAVGDELIGFDEALGPKAKFKATTVTGTKRLVRPCYRVVTDKGSVVSSDTHLWCARRMRSRGIPGDREWVETRNLQPGSTVSFLSQPWEVEDSYDAGYLAGFLDGEGYVSETIVGFGQNPGPTGDRAVRLLAERGFDAVSKHTSSPGTRCRKYHVSGGLGTTLRLLGQIRPRRLLEKSRVAWENRRTWGKGSAPATVLSVEFIGDQEVIAVETTEHTFIAEGFLSHNCQLEYRLFASLSQDPALIQAFLNGEDVHKRTAAMMFGVPYDAVTKEQRDKGKTANFAAIYGQGAKALAKQWGVSERKAEEIIRNYWARMPKAQRYVNSLKTFAKQNLYCETFFGRRRALPYANSRSTRSRNEAEREAVNTPIQGMGGDLIKMAIIRADKYLSQGFKSRLSLTVHDQLITAIHPDDNVHEIAEILREAMEIPLEGFVPLLTDAKHGPNWYDTKELAYRPSPINPAVSHVDELPADVCDNVLLLAPTEVLQPDNPTGVQDSTPVVEPRPTCLHLEPSASSQDAGEIEPEGQYRLPGIIREAQGALRSGAQAAVAVGDAPAGRDHAASELWLQVEGQGPPLDSALSLLLSTPGTVTVLSSSGGVQRDTGIRTRVAPETLFKLRKYQVTFTMSAALKTDLRAQVGAA